jgi:hypothetical protein
VDNHLLVSAGSCRIARQLPSGFSRSNPALTLGSACIINVSTSTASIVSVSTDTTSIPSVFTDTGSKLSVTIDTRFTRRSPPTILCDVSLTTATKTTQNRLYIGDGKSIYARASVCPMALLMIFVTP